MKLQINKKLALYSLPFLGVAVATTAISCGSASIEIQSVSIKELTTDGELKDLDDANKEIKKNYKINADQDGISFDYNDTLDSSNIAFEFKHSESKAKFVVKDSTSTVTGIMYYLVEKDSIDDFKDGMTMSDLFAISLLLTPYSDEYSAAVLPTENPVLPTENKTVKFDSSYIKISDITSKFSSETNTDEDFEYFICTVDMKANLTAGEPKLSNFKKGAEFKITINVNNPTVPDSGDDGNTSPEVNPGDGTNNTETN